MQSTPTRIDQGRTPCEGYVITRSVRGGLLRGGTTVEEGARTKPCYVCGEHKTLDEFHTHPDGADGRLNKCKLCAQRLMRERYYKNQEDPEWRAEQRVRSKRKYQRKKELHPERTIRTGVGPAAQTKVMCAKRAGRITPKDNCEKCGHDFSEFKREAHHPDYSRPLDVIWLCKQCHGQLHARYGNEKSVEL